MIRRAALADAIGIAAIRNPVIRDARITLTPGTLTAGAKTTAGGAAPIASPGRPPVREEAGRTPGFACHVRFRSGTGCRHSAERSFPVAPDGQGRGGGRAPMAAPCDDAAASGRHGLRAGVGAENDAALAFPSARGLATVARLPPACRKSGRRIDVMLMMTRLG